MSGKHTIQTILPGLKSGHACITPTCRINRGPLGAFDEASNRLRGLYAQYVEAPGNNHVNWHLVLVREEPPEPKP